MVFGKLNNQRGMALVFVAIALVVLLGIAALVIDLGRLYVAKQRAQNVADAAAIAAAWKLDGTPDSLADAETEAGVIVAANNDANSSWTVTGHAVTTPTGYTPGIAVQVTCQVPVVYGFAGVLGLPGKTVSATGVAERMGVQSIVSLDLVPAAVSSTRFLNPDNPVAVGQYETIRFSHQLDNDWHTGGNWAHVAFNDDSSPHTLTARWAGTAEPVQVDLGSEIPLDTDTRQGSTPQFIKDGIDQRLEGEGDMTFAAWDAAGRPDSKRLVILPIVEPADKPGQTALTVVGFAAFFLEGSPPYVMGNGDKLEAVSGRLVSLTKIEDLLTWDLLSIPNVGPTLATTVRLIQ